MFSEEALEELKNIASAAGVHGAVGQVCRFPVVYEEPGRIVEMQSADGGALISLLDAGGEPLYGIEGLLLAKRSSHTILEGNSFFLRTRGERGLLRLTAAGPGLRFAFVDGTWLGDVHRDTFLNHLQHM
jgi:hypothetical protein